MFSSTCTFHLLPSMPSYSYFQFNVVWYFILPFQNVIIIIQEKRILLEKQKNRYKKNYCQIYLVVIAFFSFLLRCLLLPIFMLLILFSFRVFLYFLLCFIVPSCSLSLRLTSSENIGMNVLFAYFYLIEQRFT